MRILRHAAITLMLLLPAVVAAAQETRSVTSPSAAPPRLEILPAGTQKLGSLGPREKRTLSYTFHNHSQASISLRVVSLPAGLRVNGPALEGPIAPDATLGLTLELDPAGHTGWFRRRVEFQTDDPEQGAYVLPLEATIRPDLAVDALRRTIPPTKLHESPEAVFNFLRESGEPLTLHMISPLPDYLEADIRVQGPKVELHLVLHPRQVPPGLNRGLETIQVETNVGDQKAFTLYLNWSLIPILESDPARLVFEKEEELELKLQRPDRKPFKLEDARIEGAGFLLPEGLDSAEVTLKRIHVKRGIVKEAKALLLLKVKDEEELVRIPLVSLPPR